jgi:competence protein ComEC
LLLLKGLLWGAPSPGSHDPSLLIGRTVEQIGQMQAGEQRWRLLPKPQALWTLSRSFGARSGGWTGTWLGFQPTKDQQRWLHRFKSKDTVQVGD